MEICERFCVLRHGQAWYALPATSVREVGQCPPLVPVPDCAPVLAGLCQWRNEFLPVLRLSALVDDDPAANEGKSPQVVVMGQSGGGWALLVDQVTSLDPLELALNSDESPDAVPIVMGTANSRQHVVRVLSPTGLLRRAETLLQGGWREREAIFTPSHSTV